MSAATVGQFRGSAGVAVRAAGVAAVVVVVVVAASLTAALPAPARAQSVDDAAERARIDAERGQAQQRLERERAECYQRFAVNDCLRRAEAAHRQTLGDLRRQEIRLNDAKRRDASAAQQRRIVERAVREGERAEDPGADLRPAARP